MYAFADRRSLSAKTRYADLFAIWNRSEEDMSSDVQEDDAAAQLLARGVAQTALVSNDGQNRLKLLHIYVH